MYNRNLIMLIVVLGLLLSNCSLNDLESIEVVSKKTNIENSIGDYIDDTTNDNEWRKITPDNVISFDTTEPDEFNDKQIFNSIEEYPKVDGSTALIPLMSKIMQNTCGVSEEVGNENIICSKTAKAWRNLASGKADLLIVGEAPESVRRDICYEYQKELLCSPIRREGLVFIVNKNNPISSLTREQLIEIYTGNITNWKELGGEDIEIRAFQRNEQSGSQTNFRKILMNDIEPIKMETYKYVDDMGGLIDEIARYDNTNNAIGYSVYYYANMMYSRDDIKMIAVDGIIPSIETISNNTYPLITESYVAIRKNTAKK